MQPDCLGWLDRNQSIRISEILGRNFGKGPSSGMKPVTKQIVCTCIMTDTNKLVRHGRVMLVIILL